MSLNSTFVNGVIVGAGAIMTVMAIAFLKIVGNLEGIMGFTARDIYIAIFLGVTVAIVAFLYEIHLRKNKDKEKDINVNE